MKRTLHTISTLFHSSRSEKAGQLARPGIVLKTSDGGFTWEPKLTGVPKNLHGIVAHSEQEIYAVGEEGTIVRSTDGGETWEQEHTDIDNNLYVITRSKDGKAPVGCWTVGCCAPSEIRGAGTDVNAIGYAAWMFWAGRCARQFFCTTRGKNA